MSGSLEDTVAAIRSYWDAHPLGLHHDNMRNPLRGLGAGVTALVIVVAAVAAIWQFVGS